MEKLNNNLHHTNPPPIPRHYPPCHKRHKNLRLFRSCQPRLYRQRSIIVSIAIINRISPGIHPSLHPSSHRRFLPFRLGWQATTCPLTVGFGIIPGNINNRVIIKFGIAIITITGSMIRLKWVGHIRQLLRIWHTWRWSLRSGRSRRHPGQQYEPAFHH